MRFLHERLNRYVSRCLPPETPCSRAPLVSYRLFQVVLTCTQNEPGGDVTTPRVRPHLQVMIMKQIVG